MAKVQWSLSMSLDGFIAGPNHAMELLAGPPLDQAITEELITSTGAILAGRNGYDAGAKLFPGETAKQAYGGAWSGPIFVLTHHPEDAVPEEGLTFINCDVAEAVRIGLEAANGKNLQIFGADIARQALQHGGLIDEFYVHYSPVMLGDGIRLYDVAGAEVVQWVRDEDPQVVSLRYTPAG